jgi:predicted DNA binding CopG/RHH family protein
VSVTIALSESDATALKGNSAIATSVTNTFLSMQQGAVVDAAGLPSPVITPVAARQASALSVDITAAILQNFTLNALNRQLILTFDEIMNPASLQSTGLQLQTHQFEADSTVVYRLTSSTVAGLLTNGTVVTIQLSEQDFAAISQVEGFARSIQTSYLRMAAFTIDDIFGRDVVAITDGKSILPNVYVPDNDPPQIIRVLLNMSTGLLALSFNEPINQTTFNVEDITIASHSNSSSAGYQLRRLVANGTAETTCLQCITTATFDHDPLKKSVILLLNDVDLDAIKVAESLAVSQNSTHVFHSAALVSDFYGNQAAPVLQSSALEANSFYHDFVRPQLVQFGLNMDSGRIFLQFSEAMKSASVNIDQFSLHRDTNATNTDTSTP